MGGYPLLMRRGAIGASSRKVRGRKAGSELGTGLSLAKMLMLNCIIRERL